jgi:hypothetical protein
MAGIGRRSDSYQHIPGSSGWPAMALAQIEEIKECHLVSELRGSENSC